MKYFLEQIAETLYSGYGNRLNEHCLVFPNRRAGLFFRKYLAELIENPVWAPATLTINDLFYSLSDLQLAENEVLLFELYKVYSKIRKSSESFDDFYFWGDMLLNDFDDVDKYLVNASQLFTNVRDLKKIDEQFGGLTKEQAEIVKRFWVNADVTKLTREKSEFLGVWTLLNDIYAEFRNTLREKNLAYEGMIFRDVAEKLEGMNGPANKWSSFHFAGFNALNNCEIKLMKVLKEEGRARFYWDYDNSYIEAKNLNSAGYFLRDNIKTFGNDMPAEWSYDTFLSSGAEKSKRRIINTSSDIAQVKLLDRILQELGETGSAKAYQTAVVLADENLLVPALSSIPEGVNDINITMGYPLRQTSIYLLVRQLLDLQMNARTESGITRFSHREVVRILKNGEIVRLNNGKGNELLNEIIEKNLLWITSDRLSGSQVLSAVFRKADSPADLSGYLKEILAMVLSVAENQDEDMRSISLQRNVRNEFIYRIILSLNRLDEIVNSPEIKLSVQTWARILDRLLRNQTVPFSGEPLSGIQIMGILETRTLDFKNLIILSVNEGVLPSVTAASSFVPFALREGFGMPSLNHQESIYAYHFYRLLHRAENVTFVYNSSSEGLRSGEMSRFLQQMKYEKKLAPEVISVSFEIRNPASVNDSVLHTDDHNQELISRFSENGKGTGRYISPSAINTWLNCRMKFYYRYVSGLEEREKVTEEIDHAKVGTLLHSTIKDLYSEYIGKVLDIEEIERLSSDKQLISSLISNNIIRHFGFDNHSLAKGNELIIRNVISVFIKRILQIDKAASPIRIISFEDLHMFPLTLKNDVGDLKLMIGGRIDRIDEKSGVIRIIDYKTGEVAGSVNSVSELFKDNRDKNLDAWLQTLLYCETYLTNKPDLIIVPSVYKLKKNPGSEDSEKLRIGRNSIVSDYHDLREEFLAYLNLTVQKIFNIGEPFTMTVNKWSKCSYCPYRKLCLR